MRRALLLVSAMTLMLLLAAGVALAVTKTCEPYIGPGTECYGTRNADKLNGTDGDDHIFGRGRGDTLKGFGGYDELYGQGGGDRLFGGSAEDTLVGGAGNDALSGDEHDDAYFFGPNWGKDSITDVATSRNVVIFSEGWNSTVFVIEGLTITLMPGAGPEATNASGTNTINWEGSVITHVTGGHGNDTITGNAVANEIEGNLGADTVTAGGGNDRIYVNDGFGGDVVNCGEDLVGNTDNDVVFHDPGDTIDPNCESPTSS